MKIKPLNEDKITKDIKSEGFSIIRGFVDKNLCNKIVEDFVDSSTYKMRDTVGDGIIDSFLQLNPHVKSNILWSITFSKELISLGKKILNDPFYRELNKDLPNFCLNFSILRSSGKDKLNIHRDDRNPPYSGSETTYLQCALALDDSNRDNGCTFVVPGSHQYNVYAREENNKVVDVDIKVGDLLIYDGRLWHGAHGNLSGKRRLNYFFGYARWHCRPTYAFETFLPPEKLANLSLEEKILHGLHVRSKSSEDLNNDPYASQRGDINFVHKNYERLKRKLL